MQVILPPVCSYKVAQREALVLPTVTWSASADFNQNPSRCGYGPVQELWAYKASTQRPVVETTCMLFF